MKIKESHSLKNMLVITGFTIGKNITHAGGVNAFNVISNMIAFYNIDLRIINDANENTIDLSDCFKNYKYVECRSNFAGKYFSFFRKVSLIKDGFFLNKSTINNVIVSLDASAKYDVIWLHWTQCATLYFKLKKIFPLAKFVLFEEDVMFLNFKRQYELEKRPFIKLLKYIRFLKIKRYELLVASDMNLVVCTNKKDYKLLVDNNISQNKIRIFPSFFQKIDIKNNVASANGIIFYGSMARVENEKAIIWFLNHVFNKLDSNIILFIVGSNPSETIKNYSSSRVVVTGFVDSPDIYFNDSFCAICPLMFGAGIKIKSLQALSCGLPLVSTDVGIEGIDAINGDDFLLANTDELFISSINKLNRDREYAYKIGQNGKKTINRYFDYDNSLLSILNCLNN